MSEQERLIADSAICRRNMTTYEQIHHDVAHVLGLKEDDVKQTLYALERQFVIKKCATPARNIAAGEPPSADGITWAWYEKGTCWPKE